LIGILRREVREGRLRVTKEKYRIESHKSVEQAKMSDEEVDWYFSKVDEDDSRAG